MGPLGGGSLGTCSGFVCVLVSARAMRGVCVLASARAMRGVCVDALFALIEFVCVLASALVIGGGESSSMACGGSGPGGRLIIGLKIIGAGGAGPTGVSCATLDMSAIELLLEMLGVPCGGGAGVGYTIGGMAGYMGDGAGVLK